MKIKIGGEISRFISSHIKEIDDSEKRVLTRNREMVKWKAPTGSTINVNFDTVFDNHRSR